MQRTTVTVIGGGQAGLAMSRSLTERSIDHLVLERSEVANSWRTERWDSLRLLTPNWLTRLPGYSYRGDDPEGYMTAAEVVDFLSGYATQIAAPVQTGVTVTSVGHRGARHLVTTDQGTIECDGVVVATGACSTPRTPAIAAEIPPRIRQLHAIEYRNPQSVEGPVLVVGASASGMQIADELTRSGLDVTIAAGEHTRLPRSYRGMDIHWWMDTIGLLDDRYDQVEDIQRARRLPSLQLIGSPDGRSLDLNGLHAAGARVVGRLAGVNGTTAQCSGSLANHCASADLKLGRLLDDIDAHVDAHGLHGEVDDAARPAPTALPVPDTAVDLRAIETVIWATGFRPDYPWLDPALLDRKGAIVHDGGVMARPGMYVLGLPFTRRRKSNFIDGVGPDAQDIATILRTHLETAVAPRR